MVVSCRAFFLPGRDASSRSPGRGFLGLFLPFATVVGSSNSYTDWDCGGSAPALREAMSAVAL